MPYSSGNPSLLDKIVRTCLNAAAETIAVQTINISVSTISTVSGSGAMLVTPESVETTRFKRTARPTLFTEKRYVTSGGRVVAKVLTSGAYDSTTIVSNDIESVVYNGVSPVNNIEIPVTALQGVYKVGDTI